MTDTISYAAWSDASSASGSGSETWISSPSGSSEDSIDNYIEYRISVWLIRYLSPLILVVGTLGNGLSLVVLRDRSFQGNAIVFALSALAAVDTSVLYTALLRQWILNLTDDQLNVRDSLGPISCKLHLHLTYFLQQLSSWTLVVVTVERTVCVAMPLIAKVLCTRRYTILIWSVIALILFGVNSHFFVIAKYGVGSPDVFKNVTSVICYIDEDYHEFFYSVWYVVDYLLQSGIPSVIILTGNTIILVCIFRAVKFRKQQLQPPSSPGIIQQGAVMSSCTAMLLGISFLFLFSTTPSSILFLVQEEWYKVNHTLHEQATMRLWFAVTLLLSFVNNAVNFVMYCVTGTRFRVALQELICGNRKMFRRSTITGWKTTQNTVVTRTLTKLEMTSLRKSGQSRNKFFEKQCRAGPD